MDKQYLQDLKRNFLCEIYEEVKKVTEIKKGLVYTKTFVFPTNTWQIAPWVEMNGKEMLNINSKQLSDEAPFLMEKYLLFTNELSRIGLVNSLRVSDDRFSVELIPNNYIEYYCKRNPECLNNERLVKINKEGLIINDSTNQSIQFNPKDKIFKLIFNLAKSNNYVNYQNLTREIGYSESMLRKEKRRLNVLMFKKFNIQSFIIGKARLGYRINPDYSIEIF